MLTSRTNLQPTGAASPSSNPGGPSEAGGANRPKADRRVGSVLLADTLAIYYQPIFSLPMRRPVAMEALLRLWDGDGAPLDVSKSIFAAEQSGQIGLVDRWVASRVLEYQGRRGLVGGHRVHINVSPLELLDRRFFQDISRIASKFTVEPAMVCFEITERMPLPDQSRFLLRRLRSMGFLVAIDDFGSGWAGIGTFADIPADIIKIDRSLVRKLHRSERARRVFASAVKMIHSVGQIAVAEGVENLAQLEFITETGCDQAQGYCLGRPLSEGRLSDLDRSQSQLLNGPQRRT